MEAPVRKTDHNIAFDVDGVLAGFQSAVIRRAEQLGLDFYDHYSQWDSWDVHDEYYDQFMEIVDDIDQNYEFWFGDVKPLPEAHIPYKVEAYVSARKGVPSGLTENWLKHHGFPEAPVYVVGSGEDKIPVLRDKTDADVFVDDKVSTIEAIQECCTRENEVPYPILFNQPHNSTYSRAEAHRIWTRAYYLPEVPRIATMRSIGYKQSTQNATTQSAT